MSEKILTAITANGVEYKIGGATKVNWDANSNMNDFKTPGVYDIYGERTVKTDNLPIMNDGGGHSFSCKLTVVASTLQPANNEICVTQFLQLSNRIGGEGATYVRTYNENNNGINGWSAWQKQMGMVETLINSDTETVGQEIFNGTAEKIGQGLNGMIDNGMYNGIYINNLSYAGSGNLYYLTSMPTFVETFVLIVINDYAATGKLGMQRHITQLKYAVNAMTGESTIKKRLGSGDETISWGDWENANGSKTILWGESSNMNDYKTAGTYEIYGDRRNVSDNLPILNSNPGHSIAAKLTVVDSSLRKTDGSAPTEICVTQFLQISNRKGGDGCLYIRTYNENNSPAADWWTPWQKMQSVQEGYIFTNTRKLNQDWGLQTVQVGLNWMVDNGNYSGVYINEEALLQKGDLDANGNGWGEINTDITKIKFIETFNITTINDYAVAGEVNNLLINLGLGSFQKERQICQVKTATDFFSSTSSIKKRVYLGNDSDYGNDSKWSEWEEIGGSGEVDITDAVMTYGLPTLVAQGMTKEGVTYVIKCTKNNLNNIILDTNGEIINHLNNNTGGNEVFLYIKKISKTIVIDAYVQPYLRYYKYLLEDTMLNVSVSEGMTDL